MTEQNNKTETAVSTAASTVAPKKAANTRPRPAGNHKEKKAKSNLSQDAAKKEKAKEKPQTAANKENRGRRGSGMAQAEPVSYTHLLAIQRPSAFPVFLN